MSTKNVETMISLITEAFAHIDKEELLDQKFENLGYAMNSLQNSNDKILLSTWRYALIDSAIETIIINYGGFVCKPNYQQLGDTTNIFIILCHEHALLPDRLCWTRLLQYLYINGYINKQQMCDLTDNFPTQVVNLLNNI